MNINSEWVVIALAGATNAGKTTLASHLKKYFSDTVHIVQDDYFLDKDDPRHIKVENLGHNNWERLGALDMNKMVKDIQEILKRPCSTPNLLILDGFLILNDPRLACLCHAKFFLDVGYEECRRRRLLRSYNPPDVPGYFDQIVWPASIVAREEALKANPDAKLLNGESDIELITKEVISCIEEKTKIKKNC